MTKHSAKRGRLIGGRSHVTKRIHLINAPPLQLTRPQEKIWAVLQEEEHQRLPIRKICELAGYHSVQIWYHVMKDEAFRAQVETLGVITRRQGVPIRFQPLVSLATNAESEWQHDVIDIRRLVADYPKHLPASAFKLDFSCIHHLEMRSLVKRYFRARIGFWEPMTFKCSLKDMKPFFYALGKTYPEQDSFSSLTRQMIEPLLTQPTWIDSR